MKHENLVCVHCSLEGSREVKIQETRNDGHVEIPEIPEGNRIDCRGAGFSLSKQEGGKDSDKMHE